MDYTVLGTPLADSLAILSAGGFMVTSTNYPDLPKGRMIEVVAAAPSSSGRGVTISLRNGLNAEVYVVDALVTRFGLRIAMLYGSWQPDPSSGFQTGLVAVLEPVTAPAQSALAQAM